MKQHRDTQFKQGIPHDRGIFCSLKARINGKYISYILKILFAASNPIKHYGRTSNGLSQKRSTSPSQRKFVPFEEVGVELERFRFDYHYHYRYLLPNRR